MLNNRLGVIAITVSFILLLYCGCRTARPTTSPAVPSPKPVQPSQPNIPKVTKPVRVPPPKLPSRPVKTPAAKLVTKLVIVPPKPTVRPGHGGNQQNISQVKLPKSIGTRFLSADNFVTRWEVCGPFIFKALRNRPSPSAAIIHYPFIKNEKNGQCKKTDCWRLLSKQATDRKFPGRVNLATMYPGVKYAAVYALAYLDIDQSVANLKLYVGCSGYIKIWLNGQLIHTYNRHNRDSHWDQDIINGIKLKKGRNQVVVKSITLTKPWSFYFRLADKNGLPLTFTAPVK